MTADFDRLRRHPLQLVFAGIGVAFFLSAAPLAAIDGGESRFVFVGPELVEEAPPAVVPPDIPLFEDEEDPSLADDPEFGLPEAAEVEDLDPEIPAGLAADESAVQAAVLHGNESGEDESIDWAGAAGRIRNLLAVPVDVFERVVRKVRGKRVVEVRKVRSEATPLEDDEVVALLRLRPIVPVQGVGRNDLSDTFFAKRSGHRRHNAIDIGAPEGTPALAAIDGTVVRFSRTRKGGIGLYLVDDAGRFSFYYAHLRKFAPGLKPGQRVRKGDVLGYVGHTGNASRRSPHLHLALSVVDGPDQDPGMSLRKKAVLNPYPLLAFLP